MSTHVRSSILGGMKILWTYFWGDDKIGLVLGGHFYVFKVNVQNGDF